MLTNALNMHLNVEQSLIVNTSSVIMFLQRIAINALPNLTIQLNNNAQIRLPSTINFNLNNDSSVTLRVKFLDSVEISNYVLVCSHTTGNDRSSCSSNH
jgi:hypothetical protein